MNNKYNALERFFLSAYWAEIRRKEKRKKNEWKAVLGAFQLKLMTF